MSIDLFVNRDGFHDYLLFIKTDKCLFVIITIILVAAQKLDLLFQYFVLCSILFLVRIFRGFLIHLDHFRHVSFFSLQNVLLSLLYENTCTHFICSSFIDSFSFEGCSILHNYFIENFPFFSTVRVLDNNIDINNDIDSRS